jgi:hypothetical protein
MPETWDWSKVGRTTWHARVGLDDGEDPWAKTLAEAEFPQRSVGLARAWAERKLGGLTNPGPAYPGASGGYYFALLERGTYKDSSYDDEQYGHVCDATWEVDEKDGEPVTLNAWLADDGEIKWGTA